MIQDSISHISVSEIHTRLLDGTLIFCVNEKTLQPGVLDPNTNTWTPAEDEYIAFRYARYKEELEQARNVLRSNYEQQAKRL